MAQGIIPRRPTPDVNPALLPLKIPVPGCVGYKSLGGDVAPALLLEKELGLEASCIRCETPTRRSLPDSPTHGKCHAHNPRSHHAIMQGELRLVLLQSVAEVVHNTP